jgi:hypothetical protein
VSNFVFPSSLKGFSLECTRTHLTKTNVQESVSGKEWRTTWWTSPRYKYSVQFEFLRNASRFELNTVFDLISRHMGAWDSFLLEDPEDKVAIDQYLGSGDDTAIVPPTFFQLQRALRARVEGKRDGGESSGHPIFNLAPASHRFSDNNTAPWQATMPWTVSVGASIQDYAGVAPDGSLTAARLNNGSTFGPNVNITHGALSLLRQNQVTPHGAYSFSLWVRNLAIDNPCEVGLQFGSGTGTEQYSDAYVIFGNATSRADPTFGRAAWLFKLNDTNWTRIGVTLNPRGGPNQALEGTLTYGAFFGQPYSEALIWGGQLESGTAHFSEYVPAIDSTAEVYGIYAASTEFGIREPPLTVWPGIGGGSEPVYDGRPCAASDFGERYPGIWGAGQYLPITGVYGGAGVAPSASALDWQGTRTPLTGLINFIRFSLDFNQSAAWTAAAAGSGSPSAPTFATLRATADSDLGHARGPDGSRDFGTAIVYDVGSGTTSATTSSITQTVDHPLLVQGDTYTFSVWMYPWKTPTNDLPPSLIEIIETTSGASVICSLDRRRSIYDSRCSLTFTAGASCNVVIRWRGDLAQATGASTIKVLTWGAQLERGSSPGWFLPTQAAGVMAAPEVHDNQPSLYVWDQGMHPFGTLLSPLPRSNLCNGSWSTGGGPSPDNPTGSSLGATGGGSVSGTSFASAITAGTGALGYQFTTGSMLCSSVYVRASTTASAITFTFGLRRDSPSNTTTNTVDFDPNSGRITRAGSRVVSAYAVPLPDRWFRLVMVSTWDNADTTQSPLAGSSGASSQTYLHIVEPGRSVGSPFVGATWEGDYTILSGPSTNHLTALPGTVLFPGDLDWIPANDPPKLGQYFTWTGGYYRRVRFSGDEVDADRIVDRIWNTGRIELISVKP